MATQTTTIPEWADDAVSGLPGLLTYQQVADALGVNVRTVRRMIARGHLTALKLTSGGSGRVRVPRRALAEMLASRASA